MQNKIEKLDVSESGLEHVRYARLAPSPQNADDAYEPRLNRFAHTFTHAGFKYDKFFKYLSSRGRREDYILCCHPCDAFILRGGFARKPVIVKKNKDTAAAIKRGAFVATKTDEVAKKTEATKEATKETDDDSEDEKEELQKEANLSYNCGIIYPPNPKFIKSYNYWHEHQAVEWSSHETRPELDREKFLSADKRFRDICLAMVTCLMHGDSVVLDTLRQEDVFGTITSREVRVFFASQISREDKHQDVYSRMLNVADEETSEHYRSYTTKMELLGEFYEFAEHYSSQLQDLALQLYFVMLCECIMFAPMFQTICYMAYADYAPILGGANAQVMRDEAIHYKHARALLAGLRVKIPKWLARIVLFEFIEIIERLLKRVVDTYETKDGLFSLDVCLQHFYHVCYGFMSENRLFLDVREEARFALVYGSSPAELYMNVPTYEIKSNLMESVSTIYAIESDFETAEKLDVTKGWC